MNAPAVRDKARRDVFAERPIGVAFDADLVVVVEPAEVIELQMPREARRFRGRAFHHASIAAQGVDVEVEHLEVGAVEMRAHPFAGHRHADAGGEALTEWASGRFDAAGPAIFRMPRASAVELAEFFDVLEAHRKFADGFVFRVHLLHARQMQHRVEKHRRMAHR